MSPEELIERQRRYDAALEEILRERGMSPLDLTPGYRAGRDVLGLHIEVMRRAFPTATAQTPSVRYTCAECGIPTTGYTDYCSEYCERQAIKNR